MSKYISITIGPITRVISKAQKTRGMWAASYLFSYLAKEIIRPFKDREFLLPLVNDEMYRQTFNGAGVFPDRFIFQAIEGDFEKLKAHINDVFAQLAANVDCPQNDDTKDVEKNLRQIFKVYFFEQERGNTEERAFIEQCEHTLSLLEEQDTFVPSVADDKDYLSRLINGDMAGMRFLMNDAGIGERFKSIVEISSEDSPTFSCKKEDPNPRRPYERYIAIIYADGDSMTTALSKVKTSDLSEALFEFNKSAVNIINGFDGQPVFVGGDDLFFFAPIFHKGKSIFRLLQDLDEAFHQALKKKNIDGPTLSFGVSVTYYKFPMSEAVILSQKLLGFAKGRETLENNRFEKSVFGRKNNVLFSVQKHSGHTRAALLHKGCTKTLELFNNMADKYTRLSVGNDDNGNKMLSSVMHNLREHEPVLFNAIHDKDLLKNYFANYYNEDGHDSYRNFFCELADLLYVACAEYGDEYSALDLSYSLLQFIHLVNSKRDE
ncbi:MAG: hypothetical protein K5660_08595 [Paludibacteraceae bacterium]|nr:hypothetical protein [Paludibacteraceae bacterium]